MKVHKSKKNCFYLATDCIHFKMSSEEDLERHLNFTIERFARRKLFRELVSEFGRVYNLEGYIVLEAHGGADDKGRWTFLDGQRRYVMQNWIDRMDGDGAAMLLHCCNPDCYEFTSQRSLIIHPPGSFNLVDLLKKSPMRLYVPGEGYIEDNYYLLRKTIDELKGRQ